ncbi:MAG: hypothetical protein KDJ97_30410 [Anaerolineae bacterium]|nr:hypothetical protein [Anaerolineae bacterium]
MKKWYTLHTKPNAEHQLATALGERGIHTYLPELPCPEAGADQGLKPFFPCYIFSSIDFETTELSQVLWTPGLRRIVSFDEQPTPVPDEIITLIQKKLSELAAAGGRPAHPFNPGDTVRIIDGPFQDMLAIFDGPCTPAERVQVLLDILGRASRVQVDIAQLEEISAPAPEPSRERHRRTRGKGRRIKQPN